MRILTLVLLAITLVLEAATLEVEVARCVIIQAADAEAPQQEAAAELRKHLTLIGGTEVPILAPAAERPAGSYPLHVGVRAPGDERPLVAEEARWVIEDEGAWFYGDRERYGDGARFAVYAFLEEQLGVRWLEPGDAGIAFKEQATLQLTTGAYEWVPQLVFRKIRQSIRHNSPHRPIGFPSTDAFLLSMEEHNARVADEVVWQKRMRMGGSRPGGGHAFHDWWEKYGGSKPEYFALNKHGKREPIPLPKAHQTNAFIKICPSNPEVADQLIANWLPRQQVTQYISTGPNDGHNFCECAACLALDVREEGEAFPGHLTDRYVHLTNIVARKAREHRADAYATLYAYLTTLYPPRRLKVEPNVVVQIVPYVIPLKLSINRELFRGWKEAGATKLALRPNYHHKYMAGSLPLGVEKQMFDIFQQAVENGTISADYDMLMGNWAVTGMADYILAKAMAEPSKPFEYWEDHYCEGYGAAAEEVKAYFRYWREAVWEERLLPAIDTISDAGKSGFFVRGLMWTIGDNDYYRVADFDRTDALLRAAAAKELSARERSSLEQLILANQHARLVYHASTSKREERYEQTRQLVAFREKHHGTLRLSWVRLIGLEDRYNWTAVREVEQLKGYPPPWVEAGLTWNFRMDPDAVGLNEKWYRLTAEETTSWDRLRTDNFWERAYDSETDPELRGKLAAYDGAAWYFSRLMIPAEMKGREIVLLFGGVGDSCQLYVNGEPTGSYSVESEAGKTRPFALRIDPAIDWSKGFQEICVRVENREGLGGITNRIWLVSKSGTGAE